MSAQADLQKRVNQQLGTLKTFGIRQQAHLPMQWQILVKQSHLS